MLYVMTSNEDRKTPRDRVMWTLESTRSITVHLNFRSESHVRNGRESPSVGSMGGGPFCLRVRSS